MRKSLLMGMIVLTALMLTAGCGGVKGTGSLEGWVYSSTIEEGNSVLLVSAEPLAAGTPAVEGAVIGAEASGITATTDADGHFLLSGMQAGMHILDVIKAGYESNRLQATVLANETRPAARAVPAKWTVLVYLDGDNNLESYGIKDVNEMETVGSTADLNMVVQFDRIPGYSTANDNWTNTRRYFILKDKSTKTISSSLVSNMAEQAMDAGQVLEDFVKWGVTTYPADNYLLVLWNHGAGVWPKYSLRGACFDDTSGSSACLTTDEIRIALANAQAVTGQRLDVLAWDSCLMQMMEVAYELRDVCGYMVGSEETVPGNGYPYNTMMAALAASPGMTPRECAVMLVDKYAISYARTSTTCSALDMGAWSGFVADVTAFASALNATASPNLPAIATISANSQRYAYPENVDLFDFASGVSASAIPDAALKASAAAVMGSLPQAVIANRCTKTYDNGRSRGVAILLPTTRTDWGYYSLYHELWWPMDTRWDEFILRMVDLM